MKMTVLLISGGLVCFLAGVAVGYRWFESQRPLEIRHTGNSMRIRAAGDPAPRIQITSEPVVVDHRLGKFVELDTDKNGKLNLTEFGKDRKPAEAEKWFKKRDVDGDGSISKFEFLPAAVPSKPR